jgi:hypothetical protein
MCIKECELSCGRDLRHVVAASDKPNYGLKLENLSSYRPVKASV